MEHVTVSIDDSTGRVTFLLNELSRPFMDETSVTARASHVEPVNGALRMLFYALRAVFGEYGRMGAFTRTLPCLWRVNLCPVTGPILPITYRDRSQAIQAEIEWLEENWL